MIVHIPVRPSWETPQPPIVLWREAFRRRLNLATAVYGFGRELWLACWMLGVCKAGLRTRVLCMLASALLTAALMWWGR